ncbi:MAG: hypothetical protein V3T08_08585 [Gemmatimonadota bacterium]
MTAARQQPKLVLRICTAALLAFFFAFMVREAVLGGCAVDRGVPSGHEPTSASIPIY